MKEAEKRILEMKGILNLYIQPSKVVTRIEDTKILLDGGLFLSVVREKLFIHLTEIEDIKRRFGEYVDEVTGQ